MDKPFSRSGEEQTFATVLAYRQDAKQGLFLLFGQAARYRRFMGLTKNELLQIESQRFEELDYQSSLTLLSSIEADLQIDFHARVEQRLKDPLSRAFRDISKKR